MKGSQLAAKFKVGLLVGLMIGELGGGILSYWQKKGVINQGLSLGINGFDGVWWLGVLLGIYWIVKGRLKGLGWGLVLGGGINGAYRLWLGGVWDWIRVGEMYFNLADVMIGIGVLWFLKEVIYGSEKDI